MKHKVRKNQDGYALLLMVLALMGVGGAVMTGYTQDVRHQAEHKRYLRNQQVLAEAKQALLQYAYNYPQLGPGQNDGPGRLPCPDMDNDGEEDQEVGCIDTSSGVPIAMVGRFPWKDEAMNFYEAKDASGERLWYAVSSNFARGLNSFVNSDTNGSIAIEDRSGALLYPATFPAGVFGEGVAAVIFAPGPPVARDGGLQDRTAGVNDPENYLDKLSDTVDNAAFVNADPAASPDGFVKGPIFNPVDGSLAVNDQMIVITAAEVSAIAEKATLQAYRRSIIDYLDRAGNCSAAGVDRSTCEAGGGTWTPVYPWLFNYDGINTVAELSSQFVLDSNFGIAPNYHDNYGRIPSLFAKYFTANDSRPIESTLDATLAIDYSNRIVARFPTLGPGDNLNFAAVQPFNQALTLPIPGILDLSFEDSGGGVGRLSTNLAVQLILGRPLYFWDLDHGGTGLWTLCPDTNSNGNSELRDCADSVADDLEILKLQFQVIVPANVGFEIDYATPAGIAVDAATAGQHAYITGTIQGGQIRSGPNEPLTTVNYEIDRHFHYDNPGEADLLDRFESFVVEESGSLAFTDLLSGNTSLALKMVYYPELPGWAFDRLIPDWPSGNGWHNSIRMAYADIYRPGAPAPCVPLPDGNNANDCLFLPDEQGARRDIASLLVIAGEHNWVDDNADAPVIVGLEDELRDVFDDGNQNNNGSFSSVRGNDKILIIEP